MEMRFSTFFTNVANDWPVQKRCWAEGVAVMPDALNTHDGASVQSQTYRYANNGMQELEARLKAARRRVAHSIYSDCHRWCVLDEDGDCQPEGVCDPSG